MKEKETERILKALANRRRLAILRFLKGEGEAAEGRNIPKSAFIEQFLGAREVVNRVPDDFGDKVVVFFVKKDFEKNTVENIVKIELGKTQIDGYIGEEYTKEKLEKYL